MKMNSILWVSLIGCAILVATVSGRAIADDEQNNSLVSNPRGRLETKDYIKISEAPPKHTTHPLGTTLELECEVFGSPPPTIKWIRGSPSNIEDMVEDNIFTEASSTALARVKSKIIIEHNSPSDRTYTCVGRAGSKIAHTSTIVAGTPGAKAHNNQDILLGNSHLSGPKPPKIVSYYVVFFEIIGSEIVIPCKTYGRPRPEVLWFDNNDIPIEGQDPRFSVRNNGDLVITGLRWDDMGGYTCIAKNQIGKDTASTFIYPVLNED